MKSTSYDLEVDITSTCEPFKNYVIFLIPLYEGTNHNDTERDTGDQFSRVLQI